MKRSDINPMPEYFDRYINQVADLELAEAFQQSLIELEQLDLAPLVRAGDVVYGAGKWTIKDTFQHLIDAEHVLSYRALRFARNDQTPLPGFDEAVLAANISTKKRTLESLLAELKIVRQGTALMFATFTDEALQRIGIASDRPICALAIGFSLLGHQKHHLKIIRIGRWLRRFGITVWRRLTRWRRWEKVTSPIRCYLSGSKNHSKRMITTTFSRT